MTHSESVTAPKQPERRSQAGRGSKSDKNTSKERLRPRVATGVPCPRSMPGTLASIPSRNFQAEVTLQVLARQGSWGRIEGTKPQGGSDLHGCTCSRRGQRGSGLARNSHLFLALCLHFNWQRMLEQGHLESASKYHICGYLLTWPRGAAQFLQTSAGHLLP